tara:strand:+ start:172 stop:942 length:771 start_codon:yes stop_codon:yes gene_type:complete
MKIALCLQGTVGNVYTNKKQYEYREDVDYRIGLEHNKKHLFQNNSIDVFIHCWNTKYKNEIVNDYNPKKYCFEEQKEFNLETKRLDYMKSRWYSQKKVIDLKKLYEHENNFIYDYVIVSRFDQAFLTDLNFNEYDPNKFWAPNDQKTKNESMNTNMFLDYFFFSNSHNMDQFSKLFDNWDSIRSWKQINMNKDSNAHEDSFIFANMLNFDIDYLFTESKDHDLVRAIYKNCEYNKKFKGCKYLEKYEQYPTNIGRF